MIRLQARVEKLENSFAAKKIKMEEPYPMPEQNQACIDWGEFIKELQNRPPDTEYERLTTAHEQAEYLRQKVARLSCKVRSVS